jgi:hypothetical protein
MSDTIATDLVGAANDIGQLLRRDGDVAEQERRITKPPPDALAEDGFFRLLTAPLLKDVRARAAPAFDHLQPVATTAGVAERAPVTFGQREFLPRRRHARLSGHRRRHAPCRRRLDHAGPPLRQPQPHRHHAGRAHRRSLVMLPSTERRSVPWNAALDDHQCEAGAKPARRIIERSPSTKGDAP